MRAITYLLKSSSTVLIASAMCKCLNLGHKGSLSFRKTSLMQSSPLAFFALYVYLSPLISSRSLTIACKQTNESCDRRKKGEGAHTKPLWFSLPCVRMCPTHFQKMNGLRQETQMFWRRTGQKKRQISSALFAAYAFPSPFFNGRSLISVHCASLPPHQNDESYAMTEPVPSGDSTTHERARTCSHLIRVLM